MADFKFDTKLPADNLITCFNGATHDCVKVMDTDATLLSFNDDGYRIMEIDNPKDVIGSDWIDFWKGDMGPKAKTAFNDAMSGKLAYFEGYCPTFKGTPKWWQVTVVPLKNDSGNIEWILSMSRDMTELINLREEVSALKLLQ